MTWSALFASLRAAFGGDSDAIDMLAAADRIPPGLSRRSFLRTALITLTAAAVVDVDQLLWMPGEKTIFLPDLVEPHLFVNFDWIAAEGLRILKRQLTIARLFNRPYESQHLPVPCRPGDDVRMAGPVLPFDPHRPGRSIVAPSTTVRLDQQLYVNLDATQLLGRDRNRVRAELLEPAMHCLAQEIVTRRIDIFADLELPPTAAAITHATQVSDEAIALRVLRGESFDVYDGRLLQHLRFDVLGGSTPAAAAREARRRRPARRSPRPARSVRRLNPGDATLRRDG